MRSKAARIATTRPTVAVVESHGIWRRGVIEILTEFGEHDAIGMCTGSELMEQCRQGRTPTLVILELHMPVVDGFVMLAWLRDNCPEVRVLAMAYQPDEATVRKAMRLGVCGVVCCTLQPEELLQAVRNVYAAGFHYNALVRRQFTSTADRMLSHAPDELEALSKQELRFVKLKCGPDAPADATVAERMQVALSTVRTYRKRVYAKLRVNSHAALLRMAITCGWVKG
jgi:DNA-binding NarL/FixJ family response regulator